MKLSLNLRVSLLCFALLGTAGPAIGANALPSYQPNPVSISSTASYVRPSGAIYVVGNDGMEDILKEFNALFTRTHPGVRFEMLLKGSSTGIGALTAGVSAFAPMGREAWPTDLSGYREMFGFAPVDIHIGYNGFTQPKHKNPPAVYVNAANPLAGLTIEQLARVFATGQPLGDITHWKQLGVGGAWAKRGIHVYGQYDDGGPATSTRRTVLHGESFVSSYEELEKPCDVVKAVAEDPYAIGLASFCDASVVSGRARVLGLAKKAGDPFGLPTYDDIAAGRYPLAVYLRIYATRAPGAPLDPVVKEYARLLLSKEGQAIIEAHKNSEEGFVPLLPAEVAAELKKLE